MVLSRKNTTIIKRYLFTLGVGVRFSSFSQEIYFYVELDKESDNWYLINHLISLYKEYVFNNRNQCSLNLKAFQLFVNSIKNRPIEFRIAKKNNNLSVNYVKWGPLYMMVK